MDENISVMNKYTELCYASVWTLVYKAQQTVSTSVHYVTFSHAPRNNITVNNGPHIGWWSHEIITL